MRLRTLIYVAIAAMLWAGLSACIQQPVQVSGAPCRGDGCKVEEYLIGPGDVLHISVWKDATLDRIVTVRPDGMISYPLLSDVRASGETPIQLQKTLTDKLKQYMADPEVSVVVQEVHSFAVSVLGEVKTPGRYELKAQATVLDVLAQAGGLTPFASASRIVILRDEDGVKKRLLFDYDAAISKQGPQQLFYVHPGDIIMVP
jgi:polysaccharide export outer membrane protein